MILSMIVGVFIAGTNVYITVSVSHRIITPADASALENIDCVIVLGCAVKPGGVPSSMLDDRLSVGCSLYIDGAAPKILMSGDHGREEYDEVNTMKDYAIDLGIPSEDIFMDHAGFSTYDSMYRARDIFECRRVLIVTQEYHLSRALYIAESLGLEAWGVPADLRGYVGQWTRDLREVAARSKDFLMVTFDADPVVLGESIPISGNGDLTND